MPLKSGPSHKEENFHELRHGPQYARTARNHGKAVANAQMTAIVLEQARKRAEGGKIAAERALPANHQLGMKVPKGGSCCANCRFLDGPKKCGNKGFIEWNGGPDLPAASDEYCCDNWSGTARHLVARATGGKILTGPIRTPHGGRTDVVETRVPDGAYVLNADTISHLGESNSEAGLRRAEQLFGEKGDLAKEGAKYASGGKTSSTGKPVECVLAGGEYAVSPQVVRAIGKGNIDLGHRILDAWMMKMRKDHIRTLANLPGPAQD